MRWAAALLVVGCGGGLAERAREAALQPQLGGDLAEICADAPIIVEERTQEELWSGRGRRAWLAPPPDGALVDEESGEVITMGPQAARYFVATCEPGCSQRSVWIRCDETCTSIGDDLADQILCAGY